MASTESDLIRIRLSGGLKRKRAGYIHTHQFVLVESCECCGEQLDLFHAQLADADPEGLDGGLTDGS